MTTTPQTNTTFEEIAAILNEGDNFVICGHVGPDGDCLGSQLAMWHALRAMGKSATCVLVKSDPIPADLAFMPGIEQMVPACDFKGTAQVFLGLDVPSRARVGEAACEILDACETSITIDHHAVEEPMCQYVYVDPDSASASMLVWEVVKHLVDKPPVESAFCAYVGLMTDTGSFRYQNADARAFECASELVAHGADPAQAAKCAYQNRSLASIKLEAAMASRIELLCGGEVALSHITRNDMQELAAVKADAEPLIVTA